MGDISYQLLSLTSWTCLTSKSFSIEELTGEVFLAPMCLAVSLFITAATLATFLTCQARTSDPSVKVNSTSLTASTLLHQLVLLSVCFIYPMSGRYSTNWDRIGWPGSEIQMYYGFPCRIYHLMNFQDSFYYSHWVLSLTLLTFYKFFFYDIKQAVLNWEICVQSP